MTRVFIGGSRSITRLPAEVQQRLANIVERGFAVLVGDANGADKVAQRYFAGRSYDHVTVFCTNGACRNNLGHWPVRAVAAARGARGFDFYAAKDAQMAKECTVGFMMWDGRSRGTLANAARLVEESKPALVYVAPAGKFVSIRNRSDYQHYLLHRGTSAADPGDQADTHHAVLF
ncbi:MAG: hypothetical protein ACRD5G_12395 [Candidatus Acidiferrales bacterium]